MSRRADLLLLARWFSDADTDSAQRTLNTRVRRVPVSALHVMARLLK